jgi:phosphoglycolate phosphatase
LGIPSEAVLYVGDSVVDAEAAMRADVPFAAVLSGSTSRDAFSDYETRLILGSVRDLTSSI